MAQAMRRKNTDSVSVSRLGRNLAAEIGGIDLSQPLDDATFPAVHRAYLENEVLIFRDQEISSDDLMAFGRRFGPLSIHPFSPTMVDTPELIVLDNHRDNPPRLTDIFHSDETFREKPPLGTVLRSTITPRIGGDTMFASMSAAYEGLNDRTQRFISGLEGEFDFKPFRTLFGNDEEGRRKLHELEDQYPQLCHPVVRVHPESGRKSIFVNRQFTIGIKGMKPSESGPLLEMLFDLAYRPEYQFRLQWQPNTIAFWDNRVVLHYAIHDYHPQRRRMERVTIAGDKPFGVDAPYDGPHIGRPEIDLIEADTPPTDNATPVRAFKQ
jgi:taurine dioxygenase